MESSSSSLPSATTIETKKKFEDFKDQLTTLSKTAATLNQQLDSWINSVNTVKTQMEEERDLWTQDVETVKKLITVFNI